MPASLQHHLWVRELGEETVVLLEPLEPLQEEELGEETVVLLEPLGPLQEEEDSLEYQVASQVQLTANQYT